MSSHAPLRLAVFDVDGTLIDSQALIAAAMAEAFAGAGHPAPSQAETRTIIGLSLEIAVARLAPDLPADDVQRIADLYRASFATQRARAGGAAESPLFPGARDAIESLAAQPGWLLGVATGKSRRGLDHALAAHELAPRFQTLQTADRHPSKPHPAMLHAALSETGTEARHAVMIGDTSFDMEMARSAGMRAVGVAWGYHPADALRGAGAEIVLDGWEDLEPFLADLAAEA